MTSDPIRGRMLTKKGGFACCPYCGKKLLRVTPDTEAEALPVQCRQCKRELILNIHRGQSFESRSPGRSETD